MSSHKRKKYIIKKTFQLKYIGTILLLILMTILLSGALVYYAVFPYLADKLANVYPQSRLVTMLANANLRLLYSFWVLIPLAIWMGIMLSHRIAGPWYRLESMLLDIAKGNVGAPVKLRKGDELRSLAEAFNKAIARLHTDKEGLLRQANTLQQDLIKLQEILAKPGVDPAAKGLLTKIQSTAKDFRSAVS